jgi:hypothetical protein
VSLPAAFTYRSARSGALSAGLALAVCVESVVLHLWLAARYPTLAWTLTALSVLTLAYLAIEYRAWGRDAVQLTREGLALRVPGRAAARVPFTALVSAAAATWRELPDAPDAGYLNVTSPAEPNVLLTFAAPVPVRVAGGLVTRRVARLGLHLDEPEAFLQALARASGV